MAEESELLLTDYLLNFEDENEGSFETECLSSGVECSDDDEEVCALSSLKDNLKTNPKPPRNPNPKPPPSKPTTMTNGREKTQEKKEKDRLRSVQYRQRRNNKVKAIEDECQQLKETNKTLNENNIELGQKVSKLQKHVEYLEKVIANESALSAVLGAITKHSGLSFNNVPLRVNSLKRKRVDNVVDENEPQRKQSNGGVCLHLTPGKMSLEFCQECDANAADE